MLPDQHSLMLTRSDPDKPLLLGPRIPYSKMPSLLPTTRVHCHNPDSLHSTPYGCEECLDKTYATTKTLETKFPEVLFIVACDFNQANLKQEIHSLRKTICAASKSGDPDQYRKSKYDLCKSIQEAKKQYRTKLEAQTYQTDSLCLWQGLTDIMGYKMKQCKIADNDTFLPDMLNAFYAQFEQNTT
eukprot:g41786.t1